MATVTNGQLLGPLDGEVLDGHPIQVGAQLDLDVERVGPVLELCHQGWPEDLRRRRFQVHGALDHCFGGGGVGGDTHLGDVVTVSDRAYRPVGRQQEVH